MLRLTPLILDDNSYDNSESNSDNNLDNNSNNNCSLAITSVYLYW